MPKYQRSGSAPLKRRSSPKRTMGDHTKRCRGCGAPIVFAIDDSGTKQVLDATAPVYRVVEQGTEIRVERERGALVSHYATCRNPDAHRTPATKPATTSSGAERDLVVVAMGRGCYAAKERLKAAGFRWNTASPSPVDHSKRGRWEKATTPSSADGDLRALQLRFSNLGFEVRQTESEDK